jgi:energy-coupling factor transport system permease protein
VLHAGRRSRAGTAVCRSASILPAGLAMSLCFVLALAAILFHSPLSLGGLTLANGVFLLLNRIPARLLRRTLYLFVWQSAVLLTLYMIRFGPAEGVWPALRSSWQLLLAFLPGVAMLHGTPQAEIARILSWVLPHRTAFALSVSLKFVPLLLREIGMIYEAQVLRGARILPRDLLRPRNWPDLLHCLIAPAVVQAMVLAQNIALAARAREFGRHPRRTSWPEERCEISGSRFQ